MWEISISCNSKFKNHLNFISDALDTYKDVKIYKATSTKHGLTTLSVATKKEDRLFISFLKDKIADAIIFIEKDEYIKKHSQFKLVSSTSKNAFKKALLLFGFEEDKDYILNKLNLNNNINIHAFFQFRLQHLKRKWEELVIITNQEDTLFGGTDVLLGFLIESIKPTDRKVFVDIKNKNFVLLNEAGEVIRERFVSDNITDEVDLVTNLIVLSPLKINILCKNNITSETYNLLNCIFNGRVKT